MFEIDNRLLQDTLPMGDFSLCRLLLMNDANYPWFILVPRCEDITEVFQLSTVEQQQLWSEACTLSEQLKDVFAADKMNLATLGNVVSQLHLHVIVRRQSDPAWPAPVWGKLPPKPYSREAVAEIRRKLQLVLTEGFSFDDVGE